MIDVFNEQIEVLIKDGISNLYWFKGDLKKICLKSGVPSDLTNRLFNQKFADGKTLSKRELLDKLYENLRDSNYNIRLEISRNFVRTLIEHKNFVPQDKNHRIEKAESVALKLKSIIQEQNKEREYKENIRKRANDGNTKNFEEEKNKLQEKFLEISKIDSPQKRGYELEKFFPELMKHHQIIVEESFKIIGEQIDGAIKYDGNYYLIELKWQKEKPNQAQISSLYLKAEGKFNAFGIFISMEGFSNEVLQSLPIGKNLKVILLDGNHLSNVIFGIYSFSELLEHAISQASLKGNIYCNHNISIQ